VLAGELEFAPGDFVDTLDPSPGSFVAEQIEELVFQERQAGQVHAFQLGFGIAVSPRTAFGMTIVYYYGTLEFDNYTRFSGTRFEGTNPGIPVTWEFTTLTSETLHGGGGQLGWLWYPRNNIGLAITVKTPTWGKLWTDQYFTEEQNSGGAAEYSDPTTTRRITLPGSATIGGSWRLGPLLLAGDVSYTDWSQTSYNRSDTPVASSSQMSRTYRETLAAGGGTELTIPAIGVALRAGVRLAQLPYSAEYVVRERVTWSGGLGLLLDRTWALDVGVAHSTYRGGNPLYGFDEGYEQWTVLLTAAFRPAGKLW
jgi:long-subunit fatty acid transport protein